MGQVHHGCATATAAVRRAIQHSQTSLRQLAQRYGINPKAGRSTASGKRLVFGVRDSGMGMTEEQRSKLFQRYAQAEASTASKFGGTGLGLSISRAFASMLGGGIEVASEYSHGSTFTIDLPATAPEKPAA